MRVPELEETTKSPRFTSFDLLVSMLLAGAIITSPIISITLSSVFLSVVTAEQGRAPEDA